ncbi:MAG: DUF1640 domain-containing protein [Nitrospira sp. SB0677_bin_15]|nr:DUF1640 domain-containing protein [Nitrospira sp. SB0667_bin_9]MYD30661.1 DUF1640 domain-containing protein [Nitrospira sp. SB0661_bin_20]MYG39406.1 DUF1640 domain-containing protein [Nitrospira sp. SB0677_bin_15]MYH01104.1 DUF1640 domain-containing protein [Nitrospira sp. SB0675_bin_23]MYJ23364.1 DUF1640 domain-containing protein [Nitrospira sp. SB0673_bin_12]
MSDATMHDTHRYVKELTNAGLSESIAQVIADREARLLESNLATKADLDRLENRLIKWFVASLFLSAGLVVAGVGIVVQVLLS